MINLQADTKSDHMKTERNAEKLMEELLASTNQHVMSVREQYLLRETLYSLARLAKTEHMLEVKKSVARLIPASLMPQPIRRGKSRRSKLADTIVQGQLVFGRHE